MVGLHGQRAEFCGRSSLGLQPGHVANHMNLLRYLSKVRRSIGQRLGARDGICLMITSMDTIFGEGGSFGISCPQ